MRLPNHQAKDNEGMALLFVIIVLVALGIMVGSVTARVNQGTQQVSAFVDYKSTFQGVESGLNQAFSEVNDLANNDGLVGLAANYDMRQGVPDFDNAAVTLQTLATAPGVEYFAYAQDWATDGIDNNGDGQVDMGSETLGYYSLYAAARFNQNGNILARRFTEQVVQGSNVNVWQNAIFAGTGQAGGLINGNVSIHGSVHLLGDALGAGGVALAAIDLSGTSLIHNNYDGLSADLEGRVPALGTTLYDGEVVETLNGKVRVKNGLVGMSGNSEVGQPHQTGNDFKETMDGVYVNDGWTGNDIDANGDPQSVWSDNGWDESYDVGNAVTFPTFSDDGGRDHLDYYLDDTIPYGEDLVLESGGDNFFYDATTGTVVKAEALGANGMPNKADLDPTHSYVWYDGTNKELVINGRVPVDGNIEFKAGSGASNKLIDYEGKGTLMAYDAGGSGGDIIIDVSLKTTTFPTTNLIGLQAADDFMLGDSSQIEIMGGFYAQDEIAVDKQTTIMGTIVGNYFNMGRNVPNIYQVPELANQWTADQRMIGADPVLLMAPLYWRELGV